MEDSKIWWYLILGAIYILSKFLKKKKPLEPPVESTESGGMSYETEAPKPKQGTPSSIEDILRELSDQASPKPEPEPVVEPSKSNPIPERAPQPIETYSRDPQPIETYSREARPIPSRTTIIEAVTDDEEIDIVPHKQILRDKPEYKRNEKFAIKEDQNELANEMHEIFYEEGGLRKAVLLNEILNRRY